MAKLNTNGLIRGIRDSSAFLQPKEDHTEDIIKYLSTYTNNGDSSSKWYVVFGDCPELENYGYKLTTGCYGPMDMGIRFKTVGAGCYFAKTNEARMEFLKWMLSPEYSPWRKYLDDDISIIEDEKFVRGFILGPKTMSKFPVQDESGSEYYTHVVLLNFLICTRMACTYGGHVDFWWKAVQLGASKEDAFIYARNFFYSQRDNKIYATGISDSGSFAFHGDINTERFKKGEARENAKYRGAIWTDREVSEGLASGRIKGYTYSKIYSEDEIKNLFSQNGIL